VAKELLLSSGMKKTTGLLIKIKNKKDDRLAWTMHFWAIFFEPRGKRQINHLMIM
jgi:hypothetical protein